jgi:hypothetical protein
VAGVVEVTPVVEMVGAAVVVALEVFALVRQRRLTPEQIM